MRKEFFNVGLKELEKAIPGRRNSTSKGKGVKKLEIF